MKIGFLGALQLIFIVLKLSHIIDWSWFWVLSPFIFVYGIFMMFFFSIVAAIMFDKIKGCYRK